MNLRKVNAKCAVKGCKNTANKVDTYNLSASREVGRSVIMCEECIREAYRALPSKTKKAKTKAQASEESAKSEGVI